MPVFGGTAILFSWCLYRFTVPAAHRDSSFSASLSPQCSAVCCVLSFCQSIPMLSRGFHVHFLTVWEFQLLFITLLATYVFSCDEKTSEMHINAFAV